jgi:hypothetical protein
MDVWDPLKLLFSLPFWMGSSLWVGSEISHHYCEWIPSEIDAKIVIGVFQRMSTDFPINISPNSLKSFIKLNDYWKSNEFMRKSEMIVHTWSHIHLSLPSREREWKNTIIKHMDFVQDKIYAEVTFDMMHHFTSKCIYRMEFGCRIKMQWVRRSWEHGGWARFLS